MRATLLPLLSRRRAAGGWGRILLRLLRSSGRARRRRVRLRASGLHRGQCWQARPLSDPALFAAVRI